MKYYIDPHCIYRSLDELFKHVLMYYIMLVRIVC